LIEFQGVHKSFTGPDGRAVVAVDGVDLKIDSGETVCLVGPSGCGKTTTLKLINRLLDPTSGRVLLDGRDAAQRDVVELRRRIGYVIQSGGLFPHMSVAANIGLLCELEGWGAERIRARVDELLTLVNLEADAIRDRFPSELSGGQRQRVGVARALALDPELLLMDEPFGALDPITRVQIHDEFERLESLLHKTVVIVTHDIDEAFRLADRVALMEGGRIVQVGSEADFRERPASEFVKDFIQRHLRKSC
jgi:osmoprotectant transport system ATP-binding protein